MQIAVPGNNDIKEQIIQISSAGRPIKNGLSAFMFAEDIAVGLFEVSFMTN